MVFSNLVARFAQRKPIAVMAQLVLENHFGAARLDGIFEEAAQDQYTRELLFSSAAQLLVEVTLFGAPSVKAAFQKNRATIPVSLVSVYGKLQRVEPAVCQALVARTAASATKLRNALGGLRCEPIPGYRLRIADGNVLKHSQRRLKELRGSATAALPGRSLALYDYGTGLITALLPCEDAHTSERKLMGGLLPLLQANDLLMADSSFAIKAFLSGLQELQGQQVAFLVRHHSSTKLAAVSKRVRAGRCKTGVVFQQQVRLSSGLVVRAIMIQRTQPLRNGKRTVTLLTNVPRSKATAKQLADLYLRRWTIEEAFRQLTQYLSCEVRTLGYPKAALLAFGLAVIAYNCLACVRGALASTYGQEKVENELSAYYLALEVSRAYEGMMAAVPPRDWAAFATMTAPKLAAVLKRVAQEVDWERYRKSPRGPKKPVSIRSNKKHHHAATARLLEKRKTPP